MSPENTSQTIFIEPYCIFCKKPANNVERRTFTKSNSTYWKEQPSWNSNTTITHTTTTTHSFTGPFPAHPECLRKFEKGRRRGLLIGIAIPILAILILGILAAALTNPPSTFLWIIVILAAAAIGYGWWSFENSMVTDDLEVQVRYYTDRHVQADAPASSLSGGTQELVVSKSGDYKSISDAIAGAQVGARILVKPGKYDGFIINKPVEIVGDGPEKQIIITGAIRIQTPSASLTGVTIKKEENRGKENVPPVEVVFGKVTLNNCRIFCQSALTSSGIEIEGPLCDVTICQCEVFSDPAGSKKNYGISAYGDSKITIEKSKIHNAGKFGISFSDCKAILQDCDISANEYSGIIIGSNVNISIKNCRMSRNKGCGVRIGESDSSPSSVDMELCDIYENEDNGIEIRRGNNPAIRNCRVHNGKGSGILIRENSQGLIEDCDIFGNALGGVDISEKSNPTIRHCQLHEQQAGIYIHSEGKGSVEDCDVFGNDVAGIIIRTGGNPAIQRCLIHNGKSVGCFIDDNGKGVVQNCKIYENASYGIAIDKGSHPVIQQCQIQRNVVCGVKMEGMSTAIVEECNLAGNVEGAWQIASDCQVNQKGNTEAA
jgi:parallel beta-helix repeat protein